MRKNMCLRLVLGVILLGSLCMLGGCTPSGSPQDQVLGETVTPEQAAESVGQAVGEFLTYGTATSDLEDAMSVLFEVSNDLDSALDAADNSIAGQIRSAANLKALQDQSLLLNGTYVEGSDPDAAAAQIQPKADCDTNSKTVVIFINGINNIFPEFLESWAALAKLLRDGPDTVMPMVDGYYNLSAVDAERSIFGGKICYLYGASSWLPNSMALELTDWCRTIGGVIIDLAECGVQTANIQRWINSVPPVSDAKKLSDRILEHIEEGHKVVIVAHSQGNLMTSQALNYLTTPDSQGSVPLDSVGVVSVGSPTNNFAARMDRVYPVMIRGEVMNTTMPGTDVPNFTTWGANADPPSEDMNFVARHSFNDSYLRSEGARNLIRQAVKGLDCNLSNPRAKFIISGIVTDETTGAPIEGALVNMIPAGAGTSQASFTTGTDGKFGPFTYRHKDAAFPQVEITVHKADYVDASVTPSYDRTTYGTDFVTIQMTPETTTPGTDGTGDGAEECSRTVEVTIWNDFGDERILIGQSKTYSATGSSSTPGSLSFTWDILGDGASLSASGDSVTVTGTAAGLVSLIAEARDATYDCVLGSKTISISIDTPPSYRVYIVEGICENGQLEVFSEQAVEEGIPSCNIGGGGLDCTVMAVLTPLTGAYPSPEAAIESGLCPNITSYFHGYWWDYVGVSGVDYCFGSIAAYDQFWACAPD